MKPREELSRELCRTAALTTLLILYAGFVLLIARKYDLHQKVELFAYSDLLNKAALVFLTVTVFARVIELWRQGEPHPLSRLIADIKTYVLEPRVLLMRLTPFIVLPILIGAYSSFKAIIPVIKPYYLDHSLYRLDHWLHFGADPWTLTHALFGSTWATQIFNFAYNAWFGVMWVTLLGYTIIVKQPGNRIQFLLSFALCWIVLGSIMATFLSSAGPCFYADIVRDMPDPYAPLMARLYDIHHALNGDHGGLGLLALDAQQMLWQSYQSQINHIGAGISAMPSMHVSIATLMAIGAWRINKKAGWAMTAYAALIMIGSVHLAWHYAVDGYVSVIMTILIWKMVGWGLRKAGLHDEAPAAAAAHQSSPPNTEEEPVGAGA